MARNKQRWFISARNSNALLVKYDNVTNKPIPGIVICY
jgi:hypothetical protein